MKKTPWLESIKLPTHFTGPTTPKERERFTNCFQLSLETL
jgi:hypothetical protein